MSDSRHIYLISEVPDPRYPQYQLIAGGDVHQSIWQNWELVTRAISNFPHGHIEVSIKAVFSPAPENGDIQTRLRFYLIARSKRNDYLDAFGLLIEQGPLSKYYSFRKMEEEPKDTGSLTCVCEVVRKTDFLTPLYKREYNDRIPESYFIIDPFIPVENNDYMALDGVLNQVKEPVILELGIEPADTELILRDHTKYLALLQSINRNWDHDDYTHDLPSQYLEAGQYGMINNIGVQKVKPLRYYDPLAENVLRAQQRFHEDLRKAHVQFRFQVSASTPATAHLLAMVFAESAFSDGAYRLIHTALGEEGAGENNMEYIAFQGLKRLATVEEIVGAFRLPIASFSSPMCIRKNTDPQPIQAENPIIVGFDLAMEASSGIASVNPVVSILLSLLTLLKHVFLCGTSGSGKTTEMMNILVQLHSYGIPFLIIEPVKTEYRVLKTLSDSENAAVRKLANDLEIYTPGSDFISPFRCNPLNTRSGIGREEHIGNLLNCFQGALPMLPFLPIIIEEALDRLYEENDGVTNPPLIQELVALAREVLLEKGYSGETHSDIQAAIELRLGSLTRSSTGKIFQTRFSAPSIEHLMSHSCVIELEQLSPDYASLQTLFLLMSIREYLITTPNEQKGLRLVIVIEEAHNLVGATGPARASEEIPDPKAFVKEAICRMLVEFRALGVAILIVDQHATTVAPEVIKATGTKIAFRQVDAEDRQELGATMLFGPLEIEEIARLKPGEAYFYTEGLHGPRKIRTPNLHSEFNLSKPLIRKDVLPYIVNDPWFRDMARDRTAMELIQLKEAIDAYDQKWLVYIEKTKELLDLHCQFEAHKKSLNRDNIQALRHDAVNLKRSMVTHFDSFRRGPYRRFLTEANPAGFGEEAIDKFRKTLVDRFEEVIQPGSKAGVQMLDDLISQCSNME